MSTVFDERQELITRIRDHAVELRRLGIARLALFGSFARGAQRADSDVDLLIAFDPESKSIDSFNAAYDLLEDALGRKIELVTIESLSPFIGPHILREAQDVIASQ
jgi:predicted nucleotidyltransferase